MVEVLTHRLHEIFPEKIPVGRLRANRPFFVASWLHPLSFVEVFQPHFNERKAAANMIWSVRKGDTLTGVWSRLLLQRPSTQCSWLTSIWGGGGGSISTTAFWKLKCFHTSKYNTNTTKKWLGRLTVKYVYDAFKKIDESQCCQMSRSATMKMLRQNRSSPAMVCISITQTRPSFSAKRRGRSIAYDSSSTHLLFKLYDTESDSYVTN